MAIRVPTGQRVAPGQIQGQAQPVDGSRGAVAAGQQLQQTGEALSKIGAHLSQVRIEQLERVNETKVNAALAESQTAAVNFQRQYSELRGANAMPDALDGQTLTDKYLGDFDRNLSEIAQAHSLNEVQLERFRARSQPMRTSFYEASTKYEAAQFDAYAKETYETGVSSFTEGMVANYQNPEMFEVAKANLAEVTLSEAKRLGLSPEAAGQALAKNIGDAITTVVENNMLTDPIGMRDLVDRNRDTILPSQAAVLDNKVGAQLDDIDARGWLQSRLEGTTPTPGDPGSGSSSPLPSVRVETTMPIAGASLPTDPGKDFGPRASFRTSNGQSASSDHDGVDFSAAAGTPVRAVRGGKVVRAGQNGGYGNWVEVELADGSRVGYAHLQDFNVKEGDILAPGQTLGRVGSTGNSTGPHLHLRYRGANGEKVDPANLFTDAPQVTTAAAGEQAARAGGTMPTRGQLIAEANAMYGNNPRRRAAAISAINEHFTETDRAEREIKDNAIDAAYAYIAQNRTMPPAAMLGDVPARNLPTLQNYLEAITAPPTRKSDESTMLTLLGDPSLWKDMSPVDFTARYGRNLSAGDLESFVRSLGSEANKTAQSAQDLNMSEFSSVYTEQLGLSGIRDVPKEDRDIQSATLLQTRARDYVLAKQRAVGRALTREEMGAEINRAVSAMAWERPAGWLPWHNREQGYVSSYSTMPVNIRNDVRRELRDAGIRNPTEDQIFTRYLEKRLPTQR